MNQANRLVSLWVHSHQIAVLLSLSLWLCNEVNKLKI